jgi:hypothetical protein
LGPTGAAEAQRGKKIGLALLLHTLQAMSVHGYADANHRRSGPHEFYANAIGAVPIAADREDICRGLLRVRPNTGPAQ